MYRRFLLPLVALALCAVAGCSESEEKYDQGAVRLHIVANSDTQEDQAIKLELRDKILEAYAPALMELESDAGVWAQLEELLPGIEASSNEFLQDKDADYSARAVMGIYDFPTRSYMGDVWPAGKYRALKVVLGDGQGQNWWCVLYPPLCFVSEEEFKDAGEYYVQVEKYLSGQGDLPKTSVRSWIADKLGGGGKWDDVLARWSAAYLRIVGKDK